MEITTETMDGVAVVTPRSEYLIAGNVDDFRRDMGPVLEANPNVVLDMSQLQFVDSSGIGAFLSCLRRVNAAGGDLKLCGITKQVYAVFQITRMHRIFDIFDTRDEAVQSFKSQDAGTT
ncbi:MAG: STAS domain-containing protein [Armatimonadetes bacterium]|nr:STAS domain-containing protein [Armatimonadota bacterium]